MHPYRLLCAVATSALLSQTLACGPGLPASAALPLQPAARTSSYAQPERQNDGGGRRQSSNNRSGHGEMSGVAPGSFDFYLMNLSWSPEFCAIQGTAPECSATAKPGFILHGLWAQNGDGSYPTFCSNEPGPPHPESNLDITPDLSLLAHEWAKHGTCSGVGAVQFFQMEHTAFRSLKVPPQIAQLTQETSMTPDAIVGLFQQINPGFPEGSILLSCGRNHLTAVEVCLDKGLHPVACQGLRSCRANSVVITPAVH